MSRTVHTFADLPRVGPYAHAVEARGFVYLSGIVPVDLAAGAMVHEIGPATRLVWKNIEQALARLDLTLDAVIKATVYLRDMGDYGAMNQAYAEVFAGREAPARTCVGGLQLPAGLPVEIDVVAVR